MPVGSGFTPRHIRKCHNPGPLLPNDMQSFIDEFLGVQRRDLKDEVTNGEDRVAFIPKLTGPISATDLCRIFVAEVVKAGYRALQMPGFPAEEVLVLVDKKGRLSIWANRDLRQETCRGAFIAFMNLCSSRPPVANVDGRYHVDHTFNKARVTNPFDDAEAEAPVVDATILSSGYLRLFLINGYVNYKYGFGIEARRSREGRQAGGFRIASWMVLLKVSEFLPPGPEMDFNVAVDHLIQTYGEFNLERPALLESVKREMRQGESRHLALNEWYATPQTEEDAYLYLNTHKFSRSRFARLIRAWFDWTIYRVLTDGEEELALRIERSDCFYLLASPYRVVWNPEIVQQSDENQFRASETNDLYEDVMPYINLIRYGRDDVCRKIRPSGGWENRVIAILHGHDQRVG